MRGQKTGGKPSRISPEVAEQIAERFGKGLKMRNVLAAAGIDKSHWEATLNANKPVRDAFEKKLAQVQEDLLARIEAREKNWQALAWILERTHGYTTAQNAAVSLNFQTLVGVSDDVLRRSRHYIQKRVVEIGPPKNKLTGTALTTGDAG